MTPLDPEHTPLDIEHLKIHGLPEAAVLPPLHPTQDRHHPDLHHATSAVQFKYLLKDGITLFNLQSPLSAQRIVIRVIEDKAVVARWDTDKSNWTVAIVDTHTVEKLPDTTKSGIPGAYFVLKQFVDAQITQGHVISLSSERLVTFLNWDGSPIPPIDTE